MATLRVALEAMPESHGSCTQQAVRAEISSHLLQQLQGTPCDFVWLALERGGTLAKLTVLSGPQQRPAAGGVAGVVRVSNDVLSALGVVAGAVVSAKRVPATALQEWLRVQVQPRVDTLAPPSCEEARFELCNGTTERAMHAWNSFCRCDRVLLPRCSDVVLFRSGGAGALPCTVECDSSGADTLAEQPGAQGDELRQHKAAADGAVADQAGVDDAPPPAALLHWGLFGERTSIRSVPFGAPCRAPRRRVPPPPTDPRGAPCRARAALDDDASIALLRATLQHHAHALPSPLGLAPLPSRVLLSGARGAGKTALAARLCEDLGLPLLRLTPADLERLGGSVPAEAVLRIRRSACRKFIGNVTVN